jgi:hypothetical protein
MATAYTSLLGLALPVTGELSGTWGSTVNTEITALLDSAIAGTTTLSSDADVTLTTTTGAANTSRQAILLWTAGGTVTRNITAPAQSKIYTVINASSSTQSIVLRGAGPTTGVTIVKGESAVCAWNGSDFIKISNTAGGGTFTNLTVTGVADFADGTAALPSITNTGDTNTGIFFPAADTIAFSEGGVEAARFDSAGNFGLGVTPSAWNSSLRVFQFGANAAIYGNGSNTAFFGLNFFTDSGSTNKYLTSNIASVYGQNSGQHQWFTAPSGTAGNTISFTQAMTLDASGNLLVGTTSPLVNASGRGNITLNGSTSAILSFGISGSNGAYIYNDGASFVLNAVGARSLTMETNGAERARIDSSGNFFVNTTAGFSTAVDRGNISLNGASTAILAIGTAGTRRGYIYTGGSELIVGADATLIFEAGGTERARIDSSGRLGIGTTSPLTIIDAQDGLGSTRITVTNTANAAPGSGINFIVKNGATTVGNSTIRVDNADNLQIFNIGGERAGITSSGYLYTFGGATVRTVQSVTAAFGSGIQTNAISINSFDDPGKQFVISNNNGNTSVFSGNGSAGVNLLLNASSWSAFSDERIKDIIEPITDAANKVATLRTVIGKYKTDEEGVRRTFLIAQDVQAVLPEAVRASEDEIGTLNLSYTDMIPLLTAAIKEQQALITQLTARITALEGA